MIRDRIEKLLREALNQLKKEGKLGDFELGTIALEHPENKDYGDYSSSIALALAKQQKKNPLAMAKEIVDELNKSKPDWLADVKAVAPGFVNMRLSQKTLVEELQKISIEQSAYGKNAALGGKRFMIEFAHPNTHKEMHIGHMRTLVTGEALSRVLEFSGAKVFRANYQGDIGPHVAKAIWGTQKILEERAMSWESAEEMNSMEKAHLLGQGYVRGNQAYEEHKEEIDALNKKLYARAQELQDVYERTRKWSLEYYDLFYRRFDTSFDKFYFESEVAEKGKQIVQENLGKVFERSEGAVIFDGEKYGLHKRVFITKDGNPTYEAKEIALAPLQYADFPFDLNVHVVANEQSGYFQVIFRALELVDEKFKGKEYHLAMGMVNLVGKKISSRTGVVITVDGLLDEVKELLSPLVDNQKHNEKEIEHIKEVCTVAAVKYSVLHTDTKSNAMFDMQKSVSLDGDSGPYLLYTYARCKSVLRKAEEADFNLKQRDLKEMPYTEEERALMRLAYQFPEVARAAAEKFAPHLICSFAFEIAQAYNAFYNKHKILQAETEDQKQFRLLLTGATAQLLKNSLRLLGIQALEKM
ncbi:MAG: arginine--tRNA ligase [Candidatus Wildermuthbacteria bacterium RIFCSPHIGHO2_01_FULL_45_20]|uniref:Arginine--tRNA ligase n=1 Tax=Candidatus Wildermuthbacteria bacterium RIFCSPHIGHO2_02_FULL_45_25 TaxID=1802450 RepID=A0A1G2R1M4_9BACT|nr:MAG: arginine--tRNA ligase [Candidatus Wildermuthbacteria bacterium RIFCSPHIGHO2_01_FULL_45_20]OHA66683.1 MAG: arginine--tRNA ligase [Candidatus Wildermuthbacteria bacterium RIFCSPHIGHO2_02_FULL_45_25]